MAKLTDARVATLKGHFNSGDQPTENQFANLIQWIQEGIEEKLLDGTGDGDSSVSQTGILMADDAWIGIGAALERIVFDSAGDISVMGAKFGINEPAPTEWFHITEGNGALAGPTVVLESNHSAGTEEMGRVHFNLGATTVGAVVGKELTANEYAIAFKTWGASAGAALSTKMILYGSGILSLETTTGALTLHRLTTAQRDALTAVNGMIIYNTSNNCVEAYENGSWVNI